MAMLQAIIFYGLGAFLVVIVLVIGFAIQQHLLQKGEEDDSTGDAGDVR